ncbi:hypothetical protein KP509_06G008200 [Ceratopteris richardii]|uniref:cytidine deaminase n=1 Tax=Ceratopteris richardii TaxID=49495 RepID=A0A8T2ULM9_CERRI|nr:hypothetical protein KP509_06G008200 [Ceratopteris richardii]
MGSSSETERMASFVIEADEVESMLMGRSMEALLSDLVGVAKGLARPPISRFYVGAVGLGASGRIFFGVNLEFAGLPLNNTVHAEQFLVANAAHHGEEVLHIIAVSAAPCGHCRQFLQELRDSSDLRILVVDEGSEIRTLGHLLPHPFGPNDVLAGHFPLLLEPHQNQLHEKVVLPLKESVPVSLISLNDLIGCGSDDAVTLRPDANNTTLLTAVNADGDYSLRDTMSLSVGRSILSCRQGGNDHQVTCNPAEILVTAATEAANRSHAPYTNSPSGVALLSRNGKIFCGSYMESVAYNPSLPPMQVALVSFVANCQGNYEDIVQAVLVEREKALIQFADTTKLLLEKISQNCEFYIVHISCDGQLLLH